MAEVKINKDTLIREYLAAMDWDPVTTKSSKKKLLDLELKDVAKELWP